MSRGATPRGAIKDTLRYYESKQVKKSQPQHPEGFKPATSQSVSRCCNHCATIAGRSVVGNKAWLAFHPNCNFVFFDHLSFVGGDRPRVELQELQQQQQRSKSWCHCDGRCFKMICMNQCVSIRPWKAKWKKRRCAFWQDSILADGWQVELEHYSVFIWANQGLYLIYS